ncbi:DUF397 domain-containing protein [Streptomyces sp. NBC_00873]|uniref:DUF397 domain-containing protein n=1 Tax=unclassified Streptomyces TaxID=2593676 RepID=UPI003864DF98|nr:DUF397 domain-containing protein [Streptomyces sp. NBC_00873]WTA45783.1 DUF397 domain-containing protein [Streptomyces sp. NBC_00842]
MSTELSWVGSIFSGNGGDNRAGNTSLPHAVRARDSKDVTHRPLTATPATWSAFTDLVRSTG